MTVAGTTKKPSKYKNKTWSRDGKSAEIKKDFMLSLTRPLSSLRALTAQTSTRSRRTKTAEVSDDDISLNFDYSTIANMDLGSDSGSNKDYDTADEN
jgi:hypothetical protein